MALRTLAAASLAILVASAAHAGDSPAMNMASGAADSAATQDYKSRMAKMHTGMGHYTGNADYDFVANMLPHHEGAVDMANVELKYGTDPELRTLAKNIVVAQEKEIGFMQAWLAKHPR